MSDGQNIPTEAINKVVSTKMTEEPDDNKKTIINYGKVDSVSIYEITETELTILEMGSPNSIYLNFFTFSCAAFLSFLTAVLTVEFPQASLVLNVFIFIDILSGSLSVIFFILWKRGNKQVSNIITKIKQRIK